MTADRSSFCQLNLPTFTSILTNEELIREKILQTEGIYSSYYRSNADKISEEIKGKLEKHFGFVKRCYEFCDKMRVGFWKFRGIEDDIMDNSFESSSIEERMRTIQPYIIEKFDYWNRDLKEIIFNFNQDHLKDVNGHVEKALQSLRHLLASGFD